MHLLPIYPVPQVQIPSESQGHGSIEVQIDPSVFKEPSIKQPQSKVRIIRGVGTGEAGEARASPDFRG